MSESPTFSNFRTARRDENLFKVLDRAGRVEGQPPEALFPYTETRAAVELQVLLRDLGLTYPPAALVWISRSGTDTARAVANLRGWLTYLPTDCVRRMALEGWHWST